MALFADGPSPSIEDLTNEDSGLLDVSRDCSINLTTKLLLAHDDLSVDLQLWLDKPKPSVDMLWGTWPGLGQIVVSAPLKRWETLQTLVLVYRDAYFSQLVDRYQAKWQEFVRLARDARERFIASGLPLVHDPMAQALPATLTTVPGPQAGGTFYASIAWVNARGQEGAASTASSITFEDGNLMTVSGTRPPKSAVGFNVYAGPRLEEMHLQNDVVLAVGSSFTYVPGAAVGATLPGEGQRPDVVRPMRRTLMRG